MTSHLRTRDSAELNVPLPQSLIVYLQLTGYRLSVGRLFVDIVDVEKDRFIFNGLFPGSQSEAVTRIMTWLESGAPEGTTWTE